MAQLTRITFTVREDQAELLAAFLCQYISHGWEENTGPNNTLVATVHIPQHDKVAITTPGLAVNAATPPAPDIIPTLKADFTELFADGLVYEDSIEEENWAEAWKEFFTPVQGGEHFYVLAPWMKEERETTSLIPILIEPKTAFGTGHHGSTSLCLDMISALYSRGAIAAATSFLDLGTGSGILGIGCAKLGLKGLGLDLDPIAIANALENRELNAVTADQFALACGTQDDAKGPYGLVIANILAQPLKDMAPRILELLGPASERGHLILSGILETQAQDVADVYTALGLGSPEIRIKGEWASLYFAPQSV